LLIDDEIEALLPLAETLRRAGLAPTIATSLDEALFLVAMAPPDIVVIDVHMAACSLLQRLRSQIAHVRFVLMVGVPANDAEIPALLAIDGVAFVEKPVHARQLIRTLADGNLVT
jgi:DNA-binding response OmpR family regulator